MKILGIRVKTLNQDSIYDERPHKNYLKLLELISFAYLPHICIKCLKNMIHFTTKKTKMRSDYIKINNTEKILWDVLMNNGGTKTIGFQPNTCRKKINNY